MNKFLSTMMATLLIASTSLCAFADDPSLSYTDFTENEIDAHLNSIIEDLSSGYPSFSNFRQVDSEKITPFANSFISYQPIRYIPKVTRVETQAFPLTIVGFDNTKHNYDSGITISYNSGHTVDWKGSINSKFSVDATIPLINKGIKAEIGLGIERTSSTSKAVGVSTTVKNLQARRGYVPIYAPGIASSGAIEYKWTDVSGKTGISIETQNIQGVFPLTSSGYKDSGVTFGTPVYQ